MGKISLSPLITQSLIEHENKCETRLSKFVVTLVDFEEHVEEEDELLKQRHSMWFNSAEKEENTLIAFEPSGVKPRPPKIATWYFANEDKMRMLMELKNKNDVKTEIKNSTPNYLKGIGRAMFIELMMNVYKFCKKNKFSLDQSGAIMSLFYCVHQFLSHHPEVHAVDVYTYFKNMCFCHCLHYAPSNVKLFNHVEARELMMFFSKLYLRNLPLIRYLCLPNYAFTFTYEIEPDPPILKKKKAAKKGKKGKKGKKK